jgi:hypothetical protein
MTLEELLDADSEKLRALSTEQLLAFFEPVLHITRPERCVRQSRELGSSKPAVSAEVKKGMALAFELGIDLSYMTNFKSKKK